MPHNSQPSFAASVSPYANFEQELWSETAGDLSARRKPLKTPAFTSDPGSASRIILDPTRQYQLWEGQGAAITDSTAYLLREKMSAEQRHAILTELFSPEQAGLNMVRISIGSCDFSSQKFYSYSELPDNMFSDSALATFSIGEGEPGNPTATKDLKYVVPVLQEILSINPALKVMASPWSPPAWMKTPERFLGNSRLKFGQFAGNGYRKNDTIDYIYAQYFVRFVQEYARYGIPIWAVTIQNEPSNSPSWPACIWTPEELNRFANDFLRPAFDRSCPQVEIFFGDDSLRFYSRPVSSYMSASESMAFAGAALHTYSGLPEWIVNMSRQFPQWRFSMTERRCMADETVDEASHVMFGEIGTWLVQHGLGSIILWNMALDEYGLPSYAGTHGRRGIITIDSHSGKVKRHQEYFLLRNFAQDVMPGSRRIFSTSYTPDGRTGGIGSVAFTSPTGDLSAILYNPTGSACEAALTVAGWGGVWQKLTVPAYGTVSIHKAHHEINKSQVPADDEFEIHPMQHAADDHNETVM